MIVKVQTPLNGAGPALVYDQAREHEIMMTLPDGMHREMMRAKKAFFEAAWDSERRTFTFGRRVDAQPW